MPMAAKRGRVLGLIGASAVRLDFVSGLSNYELFSCESFAAFRKNSIFPFCCFHATGGARLPSFVFVASLRDWI